MSHFLIKDVYLRDPLVNGFIDFLVEYLDEKKSFHHKYFYKKEKVRYVFSSFQDALIKYSWKGSFDENEWLLVNFSNRLRKSFLEENAENIYSVMLEILEWGGVLSGNKNKIFKLKEDQNLISEFNKNVDYLSSNNIDLDLSKSVLMNSGFTKIYALLIDDFIIYDSRVGAAMCLLVKQYLELIGFVSIPETLDFAYGIKKGEKGPSSRNPSTNTLIFKKLNTNNLLHIKCNIMANWIISESLKRSRESTFKTLRQVEAALFMIGYSVK